MAGDLTTAMIGLDAGRVEYRLDRRGPACVLLCHGGHVRAGLAVGEELFAELGLTVLVPSRPGYGHTPLGTGRSPAGFADAAAELCGRLGIERLAAVVGTSGGGPTGIPTWYSGCCCSARSGSVPIRIAAPAGWEPVSCSTR